MNTRAIGFLLTVLLIVMGCASKQVWVQEGKTENETEQDLDACYAQVEQHFGANLESPRLTTAVTQCMESRGYKQVRIEHRAPRSSVAPVPPGTY